MMHAVARAAPDSSRAAAETDAVRTRALPRGTAGGAAPPPLPPLFALELLSFTVAVADGVGSPGAGEPTPLADAVADSGVTEGVTGMASVAVAVMDALTPVVSDAVGVPEAVGEPARGLAEIDTVMDALLPTLVVTLGVVDGGNLVGVDVCDELEDASGAPCGPYATIDPPATVSSKPDDEMAWMFSSVGMNWRIAPLQERSCVPPLMGLTRVAQGELPYANAGPVTAKEGRGLPVAASNTDIWPPIVAKIASAVSERRAKAAPPTVTCQVRRALLMEARLPPVPQDKARYTRFPANSCAVMVGAKA